ECARSTFATRNSPQPLAPSPVCLTLTLRKLSQRLLPWLFIYAGICLLMYLLQDQLLFPGADSSAGVYYRYHNSEHSLEREGIRLQGWHRRNPQGRPQQVLLYFGGNAEDNVTALPMLDSLG